MRENTEATNEIVRKGLRGARIKSPATTSTSATRWAGIRLHARSSMLFERSSSVSRLQRDNSGSDIAPSPQPMSNTRSKCRVSVRLLNCLNTNPDIDIVSAPDTSLELQTALLLLRSLMS